MLSHGDTSYYEIMTKHIVIGTAGHIDHGKSALIKSLTGTDPDRLKEEKERGMTTDLGFAFYGDNVTIIDVPGHEKFVRHMLAGASTIDLVMLVIAADDGIMPQTIEHLEILRLLDIKQGLIVVTKKDLVEEDYLKMVVEDIKKFLQGTFLENAPIIPVSNLTNEGIDNLKNILAELISRASTKQDRGIFRMPVDRCFTIKGFGTVVAGTILSGQLKLGDTVELLPQKKSLKIRGIEVHNQKVTEVSTGFRAAINVVGAEKEEIERGDVLAQPGYFEPSNYINASLFLLSSAEKPLKNLTRLRIHLGTKEILGRIVILDKKNLQPGEKAMVQFRLETPAVSDIGDHYVIRTYSPQITLGGGVIIEPKALKVKGFDEQLIEHLKKIEDREPLTMVEENLASNFELPRKLEEIARDLNIPTSDIQNLIKELSLSKKVICIDEKRGLYCAQSNFEKLRDRIISITNEYHKKNPTLSGIPRTELSSTIGRGLDNTLLNYAFEKMSADKQIKVLEGNKIKIFDYEVALDKTLDDIVKKIEKIFISAEFQPPVLEELLARKIGSDDIVKKAYRYMLDSNILVFIGEGISMHRNMIATARERLINFLNEHKEIRVSEFRDLINASRKYALPLLIYFDTKGVTIKRGDVRVLGQTTS